MMEADIYAALEALGHPTLWGGFDDFDAGEAFPRITIQRISNATAYSLKGRADVETARIQVNVYSDDADQVFALARQVSQTLTDYHGGSVIRCKEISRRDGTNPSGGDVIRLQMLDIQVRYRA